MWISQLSIQNIRGFVDTGKINLAPNINLFVGQNNSGKTTILNAVQLLQKPTLNLGDLRKGEDVGRISLSLEEPSNRFAGYKSFFIQHYPLIIYKFDTDNKSVLSVIPKRNPEVINENIGEGCIEFGGFSHNEPDNVIYPHTAKRKVPYYDESIRSEQKVRITGDYKNLFARVDSLCSSSLPSGDEFKKITKEILGFPVSTIATENGKQVVFELSSSSFIPITQMGEGVASLLGLIVDLCVAEKKIFVIEEPENDIHPKALKSLLGLIERKSENNQFFISTHSNIVTKYLGSVQHAKVFRVSMIFNKERLPTSTMKEVENEPAARLDLLEELGYEFQDYDLYKAWLFLEESSAESIIRDFLIPTFAKSLTTKLKTFSANGVDKVKAKLEDFNKLFVFLYLQPIYKDKVWVLIDGGEREREILNDLKRLYSKRGWNNNKFLQLLEHDFEKYYPSTFESQVKEILELTDKTKKRIKKMQLVEKVKQWIKDNPEQAKIEFFKSAQEVIRILKTIAKQID